MSELWSFAQTDPEGANAEVAVNLANVNQALDSLNIEPSHSGEPTHQTTDPDESRARARAAGWAEPQPYQYATFGAGEPGEGNTLATSGDARNEGTGSAVYASTAPKYEWARDETNDDDQHEELGRPIPALEAQLFDIRFQNTRGDLFDHLRELDVDIVTPKNTDCPPPVFEFKDFGMHPLMVQNLTKAHWLTPTPIQQFVIPMVLKGLDVIGIAQTGTGKIGAYLLPIISMLTGKAKRLCAPRPGMGAVPITERVRAEPLVVIVVPTRELALQIFDETRRWCYRTRMRPCVCYGGAPLGMQLDDLRRGCDILIGTLGRINDIMSNQNALSLNRLRVTVIDEADEMLQGDWEADMASIFNHPDASSIAERQCLMFSATFPRALRKVAKQYVDPDNHVRIRVGELNAIHNITSLKQVVVECDRARKDEALYDLLMTDGKGLRTMVFVNSHGKADLLDDYLYNNHLPSTAIHASRNQLERENAMADFRHGKSPILVTTAVTARGLDVKDVDHIINYDMPSKDHGGIEEYIHRIGRTARIGNKGRVTSFLTDRDMDLAEDLVKLLIKSGDEIPEFLEPYKPTDDVVVWDDDDAWENLSELSEESVSVAAVDDVAAPTFAAANEVIFEASNTGTDPATDTFDAAGPAVAVGNW